MTSTPTIISSGIIFNIVTSSLNAADIATKAIYQVLWASLMNYLLKNWLIVTIILLIILSIAIIEALLGRWGMLGSILYNYIYFGILFIIGLILGPNIFVSNIFSLACTIILYPVCYKIVGIILETTKLKR